MKKKSASKFYLMNWQIICLFHAFIYTFQKNSEAVQKTADLFFSLNEDQKLQQRLSCDVLRKRFLQDLVFGLV